MHPTFTINNLCNELWEFIFLTPLTTHSLCFLFIYTFSILIIFQHYSHNSHYPHKFSTCTPLSQSIIFATNYENLFFLLLSLLTLYALSSSTPSQFSGPNDKPLTHHILFAVFFLLMDNFNPSTNWSSFPHYLI